MSESRTFDEWSPQGPVEELSEPSCWELLRLESFGRLAVSVDNQPQLFPVDYFADDGDILFRTAEGSKLRDLRENNSVAFEVDCRTRAESWSVVIYGTAEVVTDAHKIARADRAALPEWIPTAPYVYVTITPSTVRGRRYVHSLLATRSHQGW